MDIKLYQLHIKILKKQNLNIMHLNLLLKLDEQTGKDSSNLRKLLSINNAFTIQAEYFLRKKDFENAELWVKKGLARISLYSNEEYVKDYLNDKFRFKDLISTLLKYKLIDQDQQFLREILNNPDPGNFLKSNPDNMNIFNQVLGKLPNITNYNKLFAPYHRLIGTIHLRKEETGKYNQIRDFLIQDAVLNLEKASIEDPDYLDGLSNLGVAYNKVGRLSDSIGIFERAISINPDNKVFYINLAAVYLENNKKNEAINSLMRYYKINPKDNEIIGMLQSLGVK